VRSDAFSPDLFGASLSLMAIETGGSLVETKETSPPLGVLMCLFRGRGKWMIRRLPPKLVAMYFQPHPLSANSQIFSNQVPPTLQYEPPCTEQINPVFVTRSTSTTRSYGPCVRRNATAKDRKASRTTRDIILVSPRMRASSLCLVGSRRGRQLASGCQQSCVRTSPLHRRGRIRNVYTWCRFLV
jgi:hypothetical protein